MTSFQGASSSLQVIPSHSREEKQVSQELSSKDRPLYKMSVGLLSFYEKINKKYYEAKKIKDLSSLIISSGRAYHVEGRISSDGVSCEVFHVTSPAGLPFALKIVRVKGKDGLFSRGVSYVARNELQKLLKMVEESKKDPKSFSCVLLPVDHFKLRPYGEQCFVFPLKSVNLYQLLKQTRGDSREPKGVSLSLTKKFAVQLLKALVAIKKAGVVNADVKPENILLDDSKRSKITLADFGIAVEEGASMGKGYIQSRFYRSPEVLLQDEKVTSAIDMWSAVVSLVEFYKGTPLFPGRSAKEMILMIQYMLGSPSPNCWRDYRGLAIYKEVDRAGWANEVGEAGGTGEVDEAGGTDEADKADKADEVGGVGRQNFFEPADPSSVFLKDYRDKVELDESWSIPQGNTLVERLMSVIPPKKEINNFTDYVFYWNFINFVAEGLTWHPGDRLTPEAALNHPFTSVETSSGGRVHTLKEEEREVKPPKSVKSAEQSRPKSA